MIADGSRAILTQWNGAAIGGACDSAREDVLLGPFIAQMRGRQNSSYHAASVRLLAACSIRCATSRGCETYTE